MVLIKVFVIMAAVELTIFFIACLWMSRFKVEDVRIVRFLQLEPVKYNRGKMSPVKFKVWTYDVNKRGQEMKNVHEFAIPYHKVSKTVEMWERSIHTHETLKEIQEDPDMLRVY